MDEKAKLKGDADSNSTADTSIQSKLNLTMNEGNLVFFLTSESSIVEEEQSDSKKHNQVVCAKRRAADVVS